MNKSKITILGAGLVGGAMARDLKEKFEVLSVDINEEALSILNTFGINTKKANVLDEGVIEDLADDTDLFIGAVPGWMGYRTLERIIKTGTHCVDISFFPENALELNDLAKKHEVIAVVDCGVAPGMGNILLGHQNNCMKIEEYYCEVGGLPTVREWPYEYRAVFSPRDVIEEYTRPARFKINNKIIVREALSDLVMDQYPGVGTLESWNSDGLRTVLDTMSHIPTMVEKTLRYPGTTQYIKVLRETGYFNEEPISINGQLIKPIDVTAALMFPKWKLKEGEREFTVMRIIIKGEENGKMKEVQYYLHDVFDEEKQITSMARTTGYTCTALANMILDGKFNKKGVTPPELIVDNEDELNYILQYLKDRNVIYNVTEKYI